jgi:RNA polymerase sigma-70 factor, ECF subfamily
MSSVDRESGRGEGPIDVESSRRIHALYDAHRRGLCRYAASLLGDEDWARDVVQEVFLRLIGRPEQGVLDSVHTAWLYRVTTNVCLNALRDSRKRSALLAQHVAERRSPPCTERRVAAGELLGRLSRELRMIAVCFHAAQMTREEIAAEIRMSPRTVDSRLAALADALDGIDQTSSTVVGWTSVYPPAPDGLIGRGDRSRRRLARGRRARLRWYSRAVGRAADDDRLPP